MNTTAPHVAPRKLWILLKPNTAEVVNKPVKVSTDGCEDVDDFIEAIKKKLSPKLDQVAVDNITLHFTEGDGIETPALRPGLPLIDVAGGTSDDDPLIVRATSDIDHWAEDAVLVGRRGSSDSEGVDLQSAKTVRRDHTVARIIAKMGQENPLLVKSPPMTGKTSMATLVSQRLRQQFLENSAKCLIINLSLVDLSSYGNDWVFEDAFYKELGIRWADIPGLAKNRSVFLIFDEVQIIYQPKPDGEGRPRSPKNSSGCVWAMVKSILTNQTRNIHILFFAAYGSSAESSLVATPVKFTSTSMLGIDWLNFSDEELRDYVQRNLDAVHRYKVIAGISLDLFCGNLKDLTGSHVGLCYAAVRYLNNFICSSDGKWGKLTADLVLLGLRNTSLFRHLLGTRGFLAANAVSDDDEQNVLKFMVQSEGMILSGSDDLNLQTRSIADSLVLKGVLVEQGDDFVFSSPVMRRYFIERVFGTPAQRAEQNPATLADLIFCVVSSIDYSQLRSSLGKSFKSGILLERAWQMEFYRTTVRSTKDLFVSADVGSMFETKGAIDFTVHSSDMTIFWGIELLREANRVKDHIERFRHGKRYENLCRKFSSSCLLDFRRRDVGMNNVDLRDFNLDSNLCKDFFILSYDESFSDVVLYSKQLPLGRAVSVGKI